MLNAFSSKSVYYQSTCLGNLPRLLASLTQAGIQYTLITGVSHLSLRSEATIEMVELMLDPAGYTKFQQVFLDQRCVRLVEYGEHTFWDSRTGLTLHIMINPDTASRSEERRTEPFGSQRSHHHHSYQID
jgi:hypothetical protein